MLIAGIAPLLAEALSADVAMANEPWCFPLAARRGVSQRWGTGTPYSHLYDGGIHRGVDFNPPSGTPVYAAAGGTCVTYNGTWQGTYVAIAHSSGWRTLYAHLSSASFRPGDSVAAGQMIGRVGNTGNPTTGPHLHFEMWAGSTRDSHIDPWPHIQNAPLPGEVATMTPEQFNAITTKLDHIVNLLQVPNQGYGWPQVAGQSSQSADAKLDRVISKLGA
ncbi:M23 family metallopeptidase [Microbacterium sp.]|uniref:M23 family metallopeptidase n=1 Tax=Microbacterium sp. TaxID=51671 RepID=UPI003C71441F